uniref:Putative tick transposon n=1 Tax=Rhipicephalus pulchellus TaxID=72859 RepID=L7M1L9_RHIPC
MKVVHAFTLSRILYATPYLKLNRTETERVDAMIRLATKAALNLPRSTSTAKLFELGMHNTLSELVEAHLQAQYLRLSASATGRHILASLRINIPANQPAFIAIPRHIHASLIVKPLPRNVHPQHHIARRVARANALHKSYGQAQDAIWVDAACTAQEAVAVAYNPALAHPLIHRLPSGSTAEEAEETAIALALAQSDAQYIFTDSKTALHNYARGRIHPPAWQLLNTATQNLPRMVELQWVPAHSGNPGNEAADKLARGLICRAQDSLDSGFSKERAHTFAELTQIPRLNRRTYPPPNPSLSHSQQILWRRLQTRTLPSPQLLSHYCGTSPECSLCGEPHATLSHILFGCPADPPPRGQPAISNWEDWEVLLSSGDPALQLAAVTRAADVIAARGMAV